MKIVHDKITQSFFYNLLNNKIAGWILNKKFKRKFPTSAIYWEARYLKKGTSGKGSYGIAALYKAEFLNKFVADNNIKKVIEFGCGDGNQIKLFKFPLYIGLDVSATIIEKCIDIFKDDRGKSFFIYNYKCFADNAELLKSELVLSLDVIYHLFDEEVYEKYMEHLFSSSARFVIIYAWDVEDEQKLHVKHRKFSDWIMKNKPDWQLRNIKKNDDVPACDFFVYEIL